MKNINGGTKTVCLIGNPIAHSFSPFIHNYGFELHNINTVYLAHSVDEHMLKEAMDGIKALNYIGCNVTYPYKTKVIPLLDELSDEARLIGAVNTIKNENGRLIGYNTDGLGFVEGLKHRGFNLNNKKICILGAGGAARSIIVSLLNEFKCSLLICNRNIENALQIKDSLESYNEFLGEISDIILPTDLSSHNIDVIINCTPIGMKQTIDQIPFEDDLALESRMLVSDLIYQPHETRLLRKAKELGCEIHYGIDMLIFQAILAFKIWTSKDLPYNSVYNILKNQKIL